MKNLNLKIMRPKGFNSRIEKIVEKEQQNVKNKSGWKTNIKCPVCNFRKKNMVKRTI